MRIFSPPSPTAARARARLTMYTRTSKDTGGSRDTQKT